MVQRHLPSTKTGDADGDLTNGLDVEFNSANADRVDRFHYANTTFVRPFDHAHCLALVFIIRACSTKRFQIGKLRLCESVHQ